MRTFRKAGTRRAIATEVASLRWLSEATPAGGAAVVELAGSGETWLETVLLDEGTPTRAHAAEFGRRLALTHAAGAKWWGEAPPGLDPADLATANLPTPAAAVPTWGSFGEYYAEGRLRPYVAMATGLEPEDTRLLHRVCDAVATGRFDSPQPALCGEVARIHGDLWAGNVVWTADGVGTLIDPCANGGHAETDLAELALFGNGQISDILDGYCEVSPPEEGLSQRMPLHQLHMLLVHVVLFGGGYVPMALKVARGLLR